jgi:hypothetical protein
MQIRVKLFQQARINTEIFTVNADSIEQAKQKVNAGLANRPEAMTHGQFDLEGEVVQSEPTEAELPATPSEPTEQQ